MHLNIFELSRRDSALINFKIARMLGVAFSARFRSGFSTVVAVLRVNIERKSEVTWWCQSCGLVCTREAYVEGFSADVRLRLRSAGRTRAQPWML